MSWQSTPPKIIRFACWSLLRTLCMGFGTIVPFLNDAQDVTGRVDDLSPCFDSCYVDLALAEAIGAGSSTMLFFRHRSRRVSGTSGC